RAGPGLEAGGFRREFGGSAFRRHENTHGQFDLRVQILIVSSVSGHYLLKRRTRQTPDFPRKLAAMSLSNQPLVIAGRIFRSRLGLGTGKFSSPEAMRDALAASGAELVTVALRRADLSGRKDPFANILEFIDPKQFLLLPNTSGAMNAEEAVRLARLAAAA